MKLTLFFYVAALLSIDSAAVQLQGEADNEMTFDSNWLTCAQTETEAAAKAESEADGE